ncbi:MAG: AMP-binding protein [Pseudomonadota bacterium]
MSTQPAEFPSVYDAFRHSAQRFSSRPFLRVPASSAELYADGAVEYSYAETEAFSDALRAGYAERGVTIGDRVAVAFDSRLDVYLHLLALNGLGASIVPLMSAASDDELLHIIRHSEAKLVVALPESQPRFENLAVAPVITPAELETEAEHSMTAVADLNTEAALLYTSGTTGKPKGCMLSNDYFLAIGVWYNALGGICAIDENDRLLTPLPPNHMNALCTSFTAMLLCGGCVIQMDRFHPRSWWRTVRDERATVIHCLGVMTAILLKLPEVENENFRGQVKFNFGPGSDPRHQGAFEERFGIPVIEAWAMTESGAGGMTIAYKEPRHVGQRCIGRPSSVTEYRVVDEHDQDVALGEAGELLVRAKGGNPRKHFFSGYYKDESATEDAWRGGWWHTGDVVREGDDGSLYFIDRRKNVIRRSGENIAAVEVEATLLQHDAIKSCAVCAVPDEIRGDEVFAFLTLESPIEPIKVFEYCMERLAYFKVPAYIAVVEALPLTASQKVSRGDVKRLARECLASGGAQDVRELKKRRL